METTAQTPRPPVRCAILGIGAMGKKYAQMIAGGAIDGLTLAAVCCRSAENAAWAAAHLGPAVPVYPDEDTLYQHADRFDAVLVVTPHRLHPSMTIRAFQAGKHVLCDKPAGVCADDAQAMNEAAGRAGRVYAMMCHQRVYPQHLKLKQLLDAQAIGPLVRVSLISSRYFRTRAYHRSGSWRSSWAGEGGGLLINQAYHLLDLWQYLFGMPTALYAAIPFGKYNDFAVDDEATLVMEYPGKMTGTFVVSTGEGSQTDRLEVVGTRGRLLLEPGRLTLTQLDCDARDYARSAPVTSRQQLHETSQVYPFGNEGPVYETMLQNFADAIRFGAPLVAPGQDGVRTLELINAAYLSAWQAERVTLPIDPAQYRALLHEHEEAERSHARPAAR